MSEVQASRLGFRGDLSLGFPERKPDAYGLDEPQMVERNGLVAATWTEGPWPPQPGARL